MICFIGFIVLTLFYTFFNIRMCDSWYRDGKRTNDIWYEHVKEMNDMWYTDIVKLTKRIEELEQKINEWSKDESESLTHSENDVDKE